MGRRWEVGSGKWELGLQQTLGELQPEPKLRKILQKRKSVQLVQKQVQDASAQHQQTRCGATELDEHLGFLQRADHPNQVPSSHLGLRCFPSFLIHPTGHTRPTTELSW